ncbi:MAG: tRNA 2-thiouridine(34) synthase MnmA [Candidatus Peribacteraceae bacterium]|nr:tRNA 2-thiouridine(34) synthase MnmA [Candidatus Peribacteraceae bacterium]
MRVLVAMSGGVDSSVVAHLLKEQGHEVIGVRFRLWQDPRAPATAKILPTKCCETQTVMRARAVAKKLMIPLHEVALEKDFKRAVVDPFLAAYRKGLTPNPCVLCNRVFKFAHLLKLAKKLKCDKMATGHYARIMKKKDVFGKPYIALLEAVDARKDQSYYLHRLTQKELASTLLPLGSMTKQEVYALAEKFGVPLERVSYRESQDLCFFPEKSPDAFLRRYIRNAKKGPITLSDGTIVGTHEGLPFYTIGQRRGLNVGGRPVPVRVIRKNRRTNTLVVAPRGEDLESKTTVTSLTFTAPLPQGKKLRLTARIRALGEKRSGTFTFRGKRGIFLFDKPVHGITPGQSLVLYRKNEVLGGGILA